MDAIDSEISRLLSINAIQPCSHENGEFISNIFTRTKANGKIRIILNLKSLNKFVVYEHFKMEHLDFVCDLVRQQDWFGSIDLSDAYFAIPIAENSRKYLKFVWKGTLYNYRVLVFGLSSAPRIFTRICKPILALLRGVNHIRCSLYIDDMIVMACKKSDLCNYIDIICNLFTNLGFKINYDKSVLTPTQNIRHLGFNLNSRNLTVTLPPDKQSLLKLKCKTLLNSAQSTSIRQVASLVGLLIANCQGCKWGKLYYRDLERDKIQALKSNSGNFDKNMKISERGLDNIRWWLTSEILQPVSFEKKTFDLEMSSDASLTGWGGACDNLQTGGNWSFQEKSHHINWLELKACWLSLQCFAKRPNIHVLAKLDNTCAMYYINNKGGSIADLDVLAQQFWLWCKEHNVSVLACYLPGTENHTADFESRMLRSNTEWSLGQSGFEMIKNTFDLPDVDLFASRLNCKVNAYVSWKPDPHSMWTDAFTINWCKFKLCYAFPPFALVGKVVSKCIADKAELLLVAPFWTTQYWFPLIMDCLVAHPLTLPYSLEVISLPHDPGSSHPIWHKLNLCCFRLSGKR